jgi:hypothetical protein
MDVNWNNATLQALDLKFAEANVRHHAIPCRMKRIHVPLQPSVALGHRWRFHPKQLRCQLARFCELFYFSCHALVQIF